MNSSRIEHLVRMAVEADAVEALAEGREPEARPEVVVRAGARWWLGMSAGLAAAAAVALVAVWPSIAPRGSAVLPAPRLADSGQRDRVLPMLKLPTQGRSPMVSTAPILSSTPKREGVSPIDPSMVEQCIVVAIYRDTRGGLRCVRWQPQEWAENRCLSEVSAHELKSVAMRHPCAENGQQLVLVAMSGPKAVLPTNDTNAAELAECILDWPRACEGEGACYLSAASRCVPPGVSVKVETVAIR